ncbi:hypothetical protein Hte_005866 [Hypoxylon texense]
MARCACRRETDENVRRLGNECRVPATCRNPDHFPKCRLQSYADGPEIAAVVEFSVVHNVSFGAGVGPFTRPAPHAPPSAISPYQLGKWLPDGKYTTRPPSIVQDGVRYWAWDNLDRRVLRPTELRIDQDYTELDANRLMRCLPPNFKSSPEVFFRSLDWVSEHRSPMCTDEEGDLVHVRKLNRSAGFDQVLPRYHCAFCRGVRAKLCLVPSPVVPGGFEDLWSALKHIFNSHREYTSSRKLRFLLEEARLCPHVDSEWRRQLGARYAITMNKLERGEFPDALRDI